MSSPTNVPPSIDNNMASQETLAKASSAESSQVPDFVSDCRVMLRFARKNGAEVSPQLERQIARLDSILKANKLSPVTDIPALLVSDVPAQPDATHQKQEPPPAGVQVTPTLGGIPPSPSAAWPVSKPPLSSTELILEVHRELSRVIAPATALSLQSSEPPPGRHRFLGGMPLIVKAAAVAALLTAAGFVVTAGIIAAKAQPTATAAGENPSGGKP